jgi:hypothetical protein
LKGVVPPMSYINQLMNFLGKGYYVALLNAAALEGALLCTKRQWNFLS